MTHTADEFYRAAGMDDVADEKRGARVIYIAGPMRGTPDLGRAAFAEAEKRLRVMGWKVLNPGILPTDLPDCVYMPICLAMLSQADAVGMLGGWQDSPGAVLEYQFAVQTGKEVFEIPEV